MQKAFFIPYEIKNGFDNMRIDEELLNNAIQNAIETPIFRLYGWNPSCVSLGRNQKSPEINEQYCKQNNIDIVRRVTGGRALFHKDEVTYSFVCPIHFLKNGETVISSYREISSALALGLSKLGINITFPKEKKVETSPRYCMSLATGADLSIDGKKLIGSAQYRKHGYLLQHGSVLFDYKQEIIENIFNEKPNTNYITTINEINPQITMEQVCNSLKQGVCEYFDIDFSDCTTINFQDEHK